jgi:hypothetical protein
VRAPALISAGTRAVSPGIATKWQERRLSRLARLTDLRVRPLPRALRGRHILEGHRDLDDFFSDKEER